MSDRVDRLLEELSAVMEKLHQGIGNREQLLRDQARIFAEIELSRPGSAHTVNPEPELMQDNGRFNRVQ